MRERKQFNRIAWLMMVVVVTFFPGIACLAQEVGFVDLTQITARTELRHPLPRNDEAKVHKREGGREIYECGESAADLPALRTTLVWMDRSEYATGDQDEFEVRIDNVGPVPVRLPFSPHLADLQPGDVSQDFDYSDLTVQVWIGGARWDTNSGGTVSLYGSAQHPETMLTMRPGEWVRIIGKGDIHLNPDVMEFIRAGNAVDHANARITIHQNKALLTASSTKIVSHGVCPNHWGPNIAVLVTPSK